VPTLAPDLAARVAARIAYRKRRATLPGPGAPGDRPSSRVCRGCRAELPLEQFKRNASKPHGYDYRCKACHRRAMATTRRRDPDAHRKRSREAMRRYRAHDRRG
jgi:hypothetical protein